MKLTVICLTLFISEINNEKFLKLPVKTTDPTKHKSSSGNKIVSTTTEATITTDAPQNKSTPLKIPSTIKIPSILLKKKVENKTTPIKMLEPKIVQGWAAEIQEKLFQVDSEIVHRDFLRKSFADFKVETRNGAAIVEKMASAIDDLLTRRAEAAEAIARQAEKLAAASKAPPPSDYIFDNSVNLDELKKIPTKPDSMWIIANNCSSTRQIPVKNLSHFGKGALVEPDISSVKVALEVFDCEPAVLQHAYWSEDLLHTFQRNYAKDAMTDFQYFCSASGFLRHYPAAAWSSMYNLKIDINDGSGDEDDEDDMGDLPADVYDCRLRPWYVAASGAPRDILILFDSSGSMYNTSNKLHADHFTLALLSALTDDDQVNLYLFNRTSKPLIQCFKDMLVPANHINTAAIMAALKQYKSENETRIAQVLRESVRMMQHENQRPDRLKPCQQAIVLLTDSINENYTEIMRDVDPSGRIRLFVIWLHDEFGLRDSSLEYGEWLGCSSDGYFAELVTDFDVTLQVLKLLRVLERPLVHQRKERIRAFSDVYAHVEDPRRSEYYWQLKENEEQAFRYMELRRNKDDLLSSARMYRDYMHQQSLDLYGHYYEEQQLEYKLLISVSVPIFEDTTIENITTVLAEEKKRNATRTYPVNRLLGVAGVDIPIDHLKLMLPYYMLGGGGSLLLIDHRGNIVIHDNIKPTFDGDILRPGYRTVDFLELEQSAAEHLPRNYSTEWLEFRKAVVIDQSRGSRVMYGKNIFEFGMRALLEEREYFWRRVHNHYTAIVVLPKTYDRHHAVPEGAFTQQLAEKAFPALKSSDISVHPNWLYCKHVDQHFTEPEFEVRHFVRRRKEEPNFKMQNLGHRFVSIRPTLLQKTYMCNEELIARLCKEAIATENWSKELQEEVTHDFDSGGLGSVTAFFASESGLTRWQSFRSVSSYGPPPAGNEWPLGPDEIWYRRAVAAPDTLVIHAPVTPIRKMRRSQDKPPPLKIKDKWLTAAKSVAHQEKGTVGVAGFHFHPRHLHDLLTVITNAMCLPGDPCDQRCDGTNWKCLLIDEGGWIVSGYYPDEDTVTPEDPAREHLARLYPHAMQALLEANIYRLHWIHDYQAICFPPQEEELSTLNPQQSAATIMPSLLKSLWHTAIGIIHIAKEMVTILTLIGTASHTAADTDFDREKRHRRIWKDVEREKYERLYDPRVMVNRTRFASCDRSRALYRLQQNSRTFERLRRPPNNCTWPLVGFPVPKTNLILLAIFNLCPYTGRPVPDPLVNEPVIMNDQTWGPMTSPARLACWRNRSPLPIRAPPTTCFPHNYTEEVGYRQCGKWLPDPEEQAGNALTTNIYCYILVIHVYLIKYLTSD